MEKIAQISETKTSSASNMSQSSAPLATPNVKIHINDLYDNSARKMCIGKGRCFSPATPKTPMLSRRKKNIHIVCINFS